MLQKGVDAIEVGPGKTTQMVKQIAKAGASVQLLFHTDNLKSGDETIIEKC